MNKSGLGQTPLSRRRQRDPLVLLPAIQHYPWGGKSLIPSLLGTPNPEGRTFAEMWMGAHPGNPSFVKAGAGGAAVGLDEFIARNTEDRLGHEVSRDYGELPYLLKVLDVAQPLSIQAHPRLAQARDGFADEESRGLSLADANRKFKDPHHKPELVVAFEGAFWALCGFRPLEEVRQSLGGPPELKSLYEAFSPTREGLKKIFREIMLAPRREVESCLRPLLDRWRREHAKNPFPREDTRYWMLAADSLFSTPSSTDRGILTMLFLNLIKLNPGEGLFVPAGTLHSYLEGSAVEIMANSDNVFRGGLTSKRVDVPELMDAVVFDELKPAIVAAEAAGRGESLYRTPATEFELHRFNLRPNEESRVRSSWSGEIVFAAEGTTSLRFEKGGRHRDLALRRGESVFIPRETKYSLRSLDGSTLFRAGVPPVRTFHGRRPVELAFGTSGLRGLIADITDLEAYVNARGFLRYVTDLNGKPAGSTLTLGMDLRPSSPRIARAVAQAVRDEGGTVEHAGPLPTPALMAYAVPRGRASVMVTGSHIPFDRNGIKFNLPTGEVMKSDEQEILKRVRDVRAEEYNRASPDSLFDEKGFFRPGRIPDLPPETPSPRDDYQRRYLDFFTGRPLAGVRVVVYQHSAVGRDLLVDILTRLGAEAIARGRSNEFVPVDTEDITADRLDDFQRMVDSIDGPVDALVSTDGDSDRPLLCGVRPDGSVMFIPGDVMGPLVADYLEADGVVAPISVNDAAGPFLKERLLPLTRIGSPHVIAAMSEGAARRKRVVGYEANGGLLVQSEITRGGRRLAPLPTRDAVLPILCALMAARERGLTLSQWVESLPARVGKSGLLDPFPTDSSQALMSSLTPPDSRVKEVDFSGDGTLAVFDESGSPISPDRPLSDRLLSIKNRLERVFSPEEGFLGGLRRINFLDGVRMRFNNNDVAHIRPSGNAPQLRVYACADSSSRAEDIVRRSLSEPRGYVRLLETLVVSGISLTRDRQSVV